MKTIFGILIFFMAISSSSAQVTCDQFWSSIADRYKQSQYWSDSISDCKRGCQAFNLEAKQKGVPLANDHLKNCQLNCRDCGKKLGKEQ